MKLLWEQQKKSLTKSATGMRFHPMIIIASKSASAYDELRNSKVLMLPSRRTLRDYKNAIRPSVGFNAEVVQELVKITSALSCVQRYCVMSFDQIKYKKF